MTLMRFRSLVALLLLLPHAALAWIHGNAGPVIGKSVLNDNISPFYNNLAKGFSGGNFSSLNGLTPGTNVNNDGYPTGLLPVGQSLAGAVSVDPTYYGHYTVQWTGVGLFDPNATLNAIVYSGGAGAVGITPANSGWYFGAEFGNQSNLPTGMNVEYAYGVLMAGVSSVSGANCVGGGTCVEFTTATNGAFNWPSGTTVKCNNLTGLGTGPNVDGSWTVNSIDAQTFTLNNSAGVAGSVSITGTGGPGVQSECLANISSALLSVSFPDTAPGFATPNYTVSNFIFAQTNQIASLAAGHQIRDDVISFLQSYKPKYFRVMDDMAAQAFYANFADFTPSTALTYSVGRWATAYWAGSSAGSADNFTVTNGSSGAYLDGETVQFQANRNSTTANPTFQVNSRGQVPIYSSTYVPLYLIFSGTATAGDVISVAFSGQFSHTVSYTVQVGDNISTAATGLLSNMNADTVLQANGVICGGGGTAWDCYFIPHNGTLTSTFSATGSATEICSLGRFSNTSAFASGTNYTLIYSAVMGGFIETAFQGGTALAAPNPLAIYSELVTRANVGLWMTTPLPFTQSAYQSLGTWAAQNLGTHPVILEPMNEVWNFSANPTAQAIAMGRAMGFAYAGSGNSPRPYQDFYGLITAQMLPAFASSYVSAGGSRSNLQLVSMDTVGDGDGGFSDFTMICCRWNGIDLTGTPGSFTGTISSNTTLTVTGLTGAIWNSLTLNGTCVTGGTKIASQVSGTNLGNGVYTLSQSNTNGSCSMTVTNPVYSAISGPGGTSGTAYNAFPNRPIDVVDGVGFATYWGGALANQGASTWNGTQSNYNVLFQASANFAAGGSTNITNALNAWDNDLNNGTIAGTCNAGNGCNTICSFLQGSYTSTCPTTNTGGELRAYEADVQLYDGARPSGMANLSVYQYEGSIQQTLAGNTINGTSFAQSPTDLNAQFTANGWTLSPTYGASNLAVATNIVNLQIAYFSSTQFYNTQLNFWNAMKTIFSDRPNFAPAQFGVTGAQITSASPVLPLWGVFPGNLESGLLQNGVAEQYYNNH